MMGNHYSPHDEQRLADHAASVERGLKMKRAVAEMDPAELDERYRRTIALFGRVEDHVIGRSAVDSLDLIAANVAEIFRPKQTS